MKNNSVTKPCVTCGAEIAKSAKSCPHCGAKNKKPIYKRAWFIILIIVVVFIVGSYIWVMSSEPSDVTTNGTGSDITQGEEVEAKTIKVGDTISTESREIKITGAELTYAVYPDDTEGYYHYYPADEGEVYISVTTKITNKSKQDMSMEDDLGVNITADYNDGYTYGFFTVIEKPVGLDDTIYGYNIEPLKSQKIWFLASCPQEVEETKNPLVLNFEIEGEKYKMVIR